MTILIDSRKGSAELAPYIESPTKLVTLNYADFAFQGNGPTGPVSIGIERKSVRDLVSSIVSGRLSGHQLIGLVNSYDYVSIVVDGPTKTGSDGLMRRPKGRGKWVVMRLGKENLRRSFIDNYLYSLWIMTGVWAHFTPSARQTGLWINAQYKWWNKKWSNHQAHLDFYVAPPKKPLFRKPNLVHRMIKEIEGVGWDKGLVIADNYLSMKDIIAADEKELEALPGIGKVLAKRITDSLWGVK